MIQTTEPSADLFLESERPTPMKAPQDLLPFAKAEVHQETSLKQSHLSTLELLFT